jgi:hypothetical protein
MIQDEMIRVVRIGNGKALHITTDYMYPPQGYTWCGMGGNMHFLSKDLSKVTCKNCLREMKKEGLK